MNVRAERLDNKSIRYIYKTYMKKDFQGQNSNL